MSRAAKDKSGWNYSPQSQNELDEILDMAFVGLWARTPDDTGMDFNFVEVNDAHNVLLDSLKEDLLAWRRTTSLEALPEKVDMSKYEGVGEDGGIGIVIDDTSDAINGEQLAHLAQYSADYEHNATIDLTKKNMEEKL